MTLILDSPANMPQTHALVIGVGAYPFLKGGALESQAVVGLVGGLEQLTSPPRSAEAFAAFLLESGPRWRAPLGSIELLVSPTSHDPQAGARWGQPDEATIANIRHGYGAWKTRCSANKDNIAVFFFSGHGLEKAEHYLLAEDFGDDPNNPWLGAFAFDTTRRAFHGCAAETQCFFVDACRKVTAGMMTHQLQIGALDTLSYLHSVDCRHNLTLKAAAHNETAHGPKSAPSYFTEALLLGLRGGASKRISGRYEVRTEDIATKIDDLIGAVKPDQQYPQRCVKETSARATLLTLTDVPDVRLCLGCDPPDANAVAHLACQEQLGPGTLSRPPDPAPWVFRAKAGFYTATASFPNGQYRDQSVPVLAEPPVTAETLRV